MAAALARIRAISTMPQIFGAELGSTCNLCKRKRHLRTVREIELDSEFDCRHTAENHDEQIEMKKTKMKRKEERTRYAERHSFGLKAQNRNTNEEKSRKQN